MKTKRKRKSIGVKKRKWKRRQTKTRKLKRKQKLYRGGNDKICKIVQVGENKLMSSKYLDFKFRDSVDDDYTYGKDLTYFFLEKLTNNNYLFWKTYADKQELATRRLGVISESEKTIYVEDGIGAFLESLEMYNNGQNNIWIAYATRDANVNTNESVSDSNNIEMCFTVFANNVSPIFTHMGIFRNYLFFSSKFSPHLNLSMQLHAFSAAALYEILPNNQALVTEPAYVMANILFQNLKNTSSYWYGSKQNKEKRKTEPFLKSTTRKFPELVEYFNTNLEVESPLDDSKDDIWFLKLNHETIEFPVPFWFQKETKHPHLQYLLEKVIIGIDALRSFWYSDCNA